MGTGLMSNICPVCQKESMKTKCERCGFEMPAFAFLSEDDANEWYRDTVPPYLINWLKNQNSELHSRETMLQKQLKELEQVQSAPRPMREPKEKKSTRKRSILLFVAGLIGMGLVGAITGAIAESIFVNRDFGGGLVFLLAVLVMVLDGVLSGVLGWIIRRFYSEKILVFIPFYWLYIGFFGGAFSCIYPIFYETESISVTIYGAIANVFVYIITGGPILDEEFT